MEMILVLQATLTAPNPACSANLDGISPGLLQWLVVWQPEMTPTFVFQLQARGASVLQELSVLKAHRVVMKFLAGSQGKPVCFVGCLVMNTPPDAVRVMTK